MSNHGDKRVPGYMLPTQASHTRAPSPEKKMMDPTETLAKPAEVEIEERTPFDFTSPSTKTWLAGLITETIETYSKKNPVNSIIEASLEPVHSKLSFIEEGLKKTRESQIDLLRAIVNAESQGNLKDYASKCLEGQKGKERAHGSTMGTMPGDGRGDGRGGAQQGEARITENPFSEYRDDRSFPSSESSPKNHRTSYGNPHFILPPRKNAADTVTSDDLPIKELERTHISSEGRQYYENLNRYTRKSTLKPGDIGSFDGTASKLYVFVRAIEDTVETSGVDEKDIVSMLPRCLTGIASSWYYGLDQDVKHEMMTSVSKFVTALKEEYPSQTRTQKKEAVAYSYDPAKHDDIREYYYKKIELMRAAEPEINDTDLILEIYLGLESKAPGIAASVTVTTFQSLNEFKTELFFKAHSYQHMVEIRKSAKKESSGKGKEKEKHRRDPKGKFLSVSKKKVKPSELPNGHPCSHCKEDHFDWQCTSEEGAKVEKEKKNRWAERKEASDGKRKDERKVYLMKARKEKDQSEDEQENSGEEQEEDDSDSSDSSDEEEDNFIFIHNCIRSYFSNSPFVGSRTVSTKNSEITSLPRRDTVGTGLDYLTAHPLPVEMFLAPEGRDLKEDDTTIRGCVDSGGQCLCKRKILLDRFPDLIPQQHTEKTRPSISGIGGGTDRPKEFAVMEVYFPNEAVLQGEGSIGRRITRVTVEFQLVDELDCNLLIGREVLKGQGIRIIEDHEVIAFPDGNLAPIITAPAKLQKTAPKKLYALKTRIVPPGGEVEMEIRNPGMSASTCLLAKPIMIDRRSRFIGGMVPRCTIRGDQSKVKFKNFSAHSVRIVKNEPLAEVEILDKAASCARLTTSENRDWPTVVSYLAQMMDSTEGEPKKRAEKQAKTLIEALKEEEKLDNDTVKALMDALKLSQATIGTNSSRPELTDRSREAGEVSPATLSRPDTHTSQAFYSIDHMANELGYGPGWKLSEFRSYVYHGKAVDLESPAYATEDGLDQDVANLGLADEFPDDEKDMVTLDIPRNARPIPSKEDSTDVFEKLTVRINPRVDVNRVKEILMRNISVFGFEGKRLGRIEKEMTIEATEIPPAQPPYKESPRIKKIVDDAFKMLMEHKIIEKSESPTASPVVCVKQHGKYRFCVDFRKLNDHTPPIKYPIPRPDSVFNALGGHRFFTTVDANKAYHQFGIHKDSRKLTAFTTESKGLWQYTRVPFGLKNAPSFFQKAMDEILGSMRWDFVLAYIDDVIIYSRDFESHLAHIDRVLNALKEVGMTIDERKCFFAYESLNLLGHRINRLGLMTQPEKVKAIQNLPFPTTAKGMQRVLGQFTYYRQFIKGFAQIARPLYEAIKMDETEKPTEEESPKQRARRQGRQTVMETQERLDALQKLKDMLSNAPVLHHPDFARPFVLHTDGSKRGLAATLEQDDPETKKRHPILFISRALKDEETRYTATEIECLGVYWALHKLAAYVEGSPGLILVTDHSALKWIWKISPTTNARLHRWSLLLGPLKDKVKIEHRAGRLHSNVDPISRDPIQETYYLGSTEAQGFHAKVLSVMATDEFLKAYEQACKKEKIPDGLEQKDQLWYKQKKGFYRLWVPSEMRNTVLEHLHDKTGHPGFLRTYVSLRHSFWWKGVKAAAMEYVKSCHRCQTEKARTTKPPGDLQPIKSPEVPFHTISIDFVEKLNTIRGMNRLATVTCKFSKAICLIPCPARLTGEQFAEEFLRVVYPRWGMPAKIVSDRDPRFTGNFWKAFTSLVHTQLGMTTASHPQADGQSERTNRTIEIMIRAYVFDLEERRKEADWVKLLPVLEFEHNMTLNVTTGFAPFDLLYVVSPRRPLERALLQQKRDEAPHKEASQLVKELEDRRKSAKRAIAKAQAFQKKYYDLKRSPVPEFRAGEKVVLLPYEKAGKLDPHGRCVRIRDRVSPLAYRITVPPGSRMHDVVSIDYLRKYYRRGKSGEEEVVSEESEDEPVVEEEVESIIGQRKAMKGDGWEYLVKWKDYADKELTWVHENELGNAREAVRIYQEATRL